MECISHALPFENGKVRLGVSVWDSPMKPELGEELMPQFYRSAMGALVIFDLTSRDTFLAAAKWINEVKQKASSKCQIILIGNKSDRCRSKFVIDEEEEEEKKLGEQQNTVSDEERKGPIVSDEVEENQSEITSPTISFVRGSTMNGSSGEAVSSPSDSVQGTEKVGDNSSINLLASQ